MPADARPVPAAGPGSLPVGIAAAAVLAALVLVDPGAEDAFEAPKRLAIAAAGAAAVAVWAWGRLRSVAGQRVLPPRAAAVALLFGGALAWAAAAALLSPRAGTAILALPPLQLFAAVALLGALLPPAAFAPTLGALFAASAVNGALAVLQATRVFSPFVLERGAGRGGVVGLVGNEGVLACALALALVAALAVTVGARGRAVRGVAAAAGLLSFAGVLATRNLTALAALFAGVATLALLRGGKRVLKPAALAVVLALAAAGLAPGSRERIASAAADAAAGRWDALVTGRAGAWAAAVEMVRDRPLLGSGPGTYEAGYVPARLAAELRLRRRLPPPDPATGAAEAHAEPLDAAAAAGLPGLLLALGAAGLLLGGLAAAARDPGCPDRGAAAASAALLVTGGVAAFSWFPLQRGATATPLLLVAGYGWGILAARGRGAGAIAATKPSRLRGRVAPLVVLALALVALAAEGRRYSLERRLHDATALARSAAAGTAGVDGYATAFAVAQRLAAELSHDARPAALAGGALLYARRPEEALPWYRRANARGEHAEYDLNIGRALALLDRREAALGAFVRAAWIAPGMVAAMPAAARPFVEREVARLEGLLRAGLLAAPPPAP